MAQYKKTDDAYGEDDLIVAFLRAAAGGVLTAVRRLRNDR